jgi:hypothetical protein
LAACAGSGAPPTTSGIPNGTSAFTRSFSPDKCGSDHGVSVKPCKVTLTTSHPYATVTVTSPASSTTIVSDKKCTKKDVAEVEGAGSTYTVTAGTMSGSCSAVFKAKNTKGHNVGKATLDITNKV